MNTSLTTGAATEGSPDTDERAAVTQAIDGVECDGFSPGHLGSRRPEPASNEFGTGDDARADEHGWLLAEPSRTRHRRGLPLSMVATGVIALGLVVSGGYGVMQDRSELQREVSRLQSDLARSIAPAEVQDLRNALVRAEDETRTLRDRLASADAELEGLRASLGAMEQRLSMQHSGPESSLSVATASGTRLPAAEKIGPQTADSSGWFVNFSSYNRREMADRWAEKLQPAEGAVTISSVDNGGRTIYRLRVVGLDSRQRAVAVARQLEQAHGLESLWIGRQ